MSDFKINAAKAQEQLNRLIAKEDKKDLKDRAKAGAYRKLQDTIWRKHKKTYTAKEVMDIFKKNFKKNPEEALQTIQNYYKDLKDPSKKFDSSNPDQAIAEFIKDYYGVKDIENRNEFRNFFNSFISDLGSSFSKGKTKVERFFRLLKK